MDRRRFLLAVGCGIAVFLLPRKIKAQDQMYVHHFHGGPLDGKVLTTPKSLVPSYVHVTEIPAFDRDGVKKVLRFDIYDVQRDRGYRLDLIFRKSTYASRNR